MEAKNTLTGSKKDVGVDTTHFRLNLKVFKYRAT